ncbi:radical SAM protein [Clostridium sp. HBUAS56017]|uniref:radical SAM protein n=1 Tax=Clostridium sp. HBUAS56017 TaxID=2571128 RepID=UPI001178525C|nr:radical SAM protein [Clostridium sp. HBUAS56017]
MFNSTVLVEPTNICNLKCVMCEARCTVEAGNEKVQYLMPDQLDIMLSKLNGYISNVVFQGDCEPTLNPYLEGLVDVARKYTEQVAIVTNGIMLTPERIDSLIANGVTWFALSIDDHREQIYNGIRKYSDFKKVEQNLDYLIKVRNERNNSIFIVTHKIVFENDTIDSLKEYVKYFYIDKGVNKITFAPLVCEGSIKKKNWIIIRNKLENSLIQENIHINLSDFANYPYATLHKYCGTNLFFISHEGNFAPCGLHTRDGNNFGNLLVESLEDIKEKDVFKEYHSFWKNRKYDCKKPRVCENCYLLRSPYFKYCLNEGYEAGKCFDLEKV